MNNDKRKDWMFFFFDLLVTLMWAAAALWEYHTENPSTMMFVTELICSLIWGLETGFDAANLF